MSIEVFRSGRTFYVHTAMLLNIPEKEYEGFFNVPNWYAIATAKYLGLDSLRNFKLNEYARRTGRSNQLSAAISEAAFGDLLSKLNSGEINVAQYTAEIEKLRGSANPTIEELQTTIEQRSGIRNDIWEKAKYDIIDSIVPFEVGSVTELEDPEILLRVRNLGITKLSLIDDFPIIIASYGFSRLEANPQLCYLNPFPADREQGGKYPVFVDRVQADAILFQLDPHKVINWLRLNGYEVTLPNGSDAQSSALSYFVNLFYKTEGGELIDINIHEKIFNDQPIVRLVLGLVHTFSHLAIRHAALLCGLDKTSISEYIVPKTLSFALYCNHRFGATIGALTALFEQSVSEWLDEIDSERRCVYDPVCYEKGGNCHSCTHLAETSCKLFNQNLGRIYLFGGYDHELERDIVGYFDPRIQNI